MTARDEARKLRSEAADIERNIVSLAETRERFLLVADRHTTAMDAGARASVSLVRRAKELERIADVIDATEAEDIAAAIADVDREDAS